MYKSFLERRDVSQILTIVRAEQLKLDRSFGVSASRTWEPDGIHDPGMPSRLAGAAADRIAKGEQSQQIAEPKMRDANFGGSTLVTIEGHRSLAGWGMRPGQLLLSKHGCDEDDMKAGFGAPEMVLRSSFGGFALG
jgi:hypothetical protein